MPGEESSTGASASFRDANDAQQLRAVLLLQNLPVELSSSNVKGQLWHRVVVGPFTRKLDAERARTKLREQDLPAILMRDKAKLNPPCSAHATSTTKRAFMQQFHGTTIISVRDAHSVALGGDGHIPWRYSNEGQCR